MDDRSGLTYVNDRARALLGGAEFEPGAQLASVLPRLAGSRLVRALTTAAQERVTLEFTEDVPALDRTLEVRVFPQDGGAGELLRDVTAARRAGRTNARLMSVTTRLAEVILPEDAIELILGEALPAVGAFGGSVYRLADRRRLTLLGLSGYDAAAVHTWRVLTLDQDVMLAEAARTRTPLFMTAADLREHYPHLPLRSGTVSAAALPLIARGALLGVMGLSFETDHELDAQERGVLRAMAGQCALALDRATLYEAVRDERDRLATLVRASTQLVWTVTPGRGVTAPWWLELTG